MVALERIPLENVSSSVSDHSTVPQVLCPLDSPKVRRSNSFTRRNKPLSLLKTGASVDNLSEDSATTTRLLKSILRDTQKQSFFKKSLSFSQSCIENIRHFQTLDPPLTIGFHDQVVLPDIIDKSAGSISATLLIPQWWKICTMSSIQPPILTGFAVILDGVSLVENKLSVGVLVQNIAFEKHVSLRLTWDGWKSYRDVEATFASTLSSCSVHAKGIDRFTVMLDLEKEIDGEWADLEFAIRYRVLDQEYWDNNSTLNHKIQLSRPSLATRLAFPGVATSPTSPTALYQFPIPSSVEPSLLDAPSLPPSVVAPALSHTPHLFWHPTKNMVQNFNGSPTQGMGATFLPPDPRATGRPRAQSLPGQVNQSFFSRGGPPASRRAYHSLTTLITPPSSWTQPLGPKY
ncbi:hypothetical protein HDV03_000491 [Kappamyces sp. JEL0829]|nr:hypothetical protein HDV03_000491 [Kappamyces sp. JEL0829]